MQLVYHCIIGRDLDRLLLRSLELERVLRGKEFALRNTLQIKEYSRRGCPPEGAILGSGVTLCSSGGQTLKGPSSNSVLLGPISFGSFQSPNHRTV